MLAKNKSARYAQKINGMQVNITLKEDPKPAIMIINNEYKSDNDSLYPKNKSRIRI